MSDSKNISRTIVNIDHLVLRGVDPHHAHALAESLKEQLAKQLSNSARVQQILSSSDSRVLKLGRIPLSPGRIGARNFGANLARVIASRTVGTKRTSSKGATR
jgi:hypothetical protein